MQLRSETFFDESSHHDTHPVFKRHENEIFEMTMRNNNRVIKQDCGKFGAISRTFTPSRCHHAISRLVAALRAAAGSVN